LVETLEGLARLASMMPATRAHVVGEGIGLQVAEAACDYIHLYRGDREALTSSLDHIQHAASQILRAIEAGG